MDVKDKLELLAESRDWRFIHARRDYQNLTEALDFVNDEMEGYGIGETMLFLDPVVSDGSGTDGVVYTGNFMVLTKSDIDDTYKNKYDKFIKDLKEEILNSFKNNMRCDFTINQWRVIEVINVFDINADGVNVQFNVKG